MLQEEGYFCDLSVVASENSSKLYKSSQKGFDVVISVFCSSDSEHKKITDLLNVYEIPFNY